MKKTLIALSAALILTSAPAFAGTGHSHSAEETSHSHGGAHDDHHSQIEALNVSADEAMAILEEGLTEVAKKIEAKTADDATAGALNLMSAVKTLQSANPSERQAAALKQFDQQIDNATHAVEDTDWAKAKSSITKAQSALKLYKAVQ